MTIKEFNKFFKSEKCTMMTMIERDEEFLTYRTAYNSEDLLNNTLKKVKNGKTKKQLKYSIIKWREKLEKIIEKNDQRNETGIYSIG